MPDSVLTRPFTGLQNAVEYTYRIFAINVAGDSDWTSASALTLANPVAAPAVPTGLQAMPGPGLINLSWTEPVFNGGAAVTGYRYRYKKEASTSWTGWFGNGTDLKVEISPLDPGVLYDFEVTATNSAGTGPAAEVEGTPGSTAPTAAPSVTVVLSRDSTNDDNREQIKIEWRELTTAQSGGDGIEGYEVEWKIGDGDWVATGSSDPAYNVTMPESLGDLYVAFHPESGNSGVALAPGTTYTYRGPRL